MGARPGHRHPGFGASQGGRRVVATDLAHMTAARALSCASRGPLRRLRRAGGRRHRSPTPCSVPPAAREGQQQAPTRAVPGPAAADKEALV